MHARRWLPLKSWIHLTSRDPRLALARDAADAHGGAPDEGWVEQAVVLLRDFSSEGDVVLDPFAGYGTTLVACALERRRGIGIEIDPARVRTIERRLAACGIAGADGQRIELGDARAPPVDASSVALVLTSIPYWGHARATTPAVPGQLYAASRYDDYLALLDAAFAAVARALAPGGRAAILAENVTGDDGSFVPLAWDAGRVLGRHLVLRSERVIVYDGERRERAHEYVLVAEKCA